MIESKKEESFETVIQGCLGQLFTAQFIIVVGVLVRCFTVYSLWGWFIVPFGVVQIGMAWAFGLSTFIHLFTSHQKITSDSKKFGVSEMFLALGAIIAHNGLALLSGYIAHKLM